MNQKQWCDEAQMELAEHLSYGHHRLHAFPMNPQDLCKMSSSNQSSIPSSSSQCSHPSISGSPRPQGIEAMVCADIARRQALGIAKYGKTVSDNPLSLRQWLNHQYEELLDAAVYCRRAIAEIDREEPDLK